jgi:outer membrane protein OmpA-like peptidoglycan-associated protein
MFLTLALLMSFSSAHAEQTEFQAQRFRPWHDPSGMFQTLSGKTLGQWGFVGGLTFNYGNNPLTLRNPDRSKLADVLQHQVGADLTLGLGFLSWLDLHVTLPMTVYQIGSIPSISTFPSSLRGRDLTGFQLSDLKVMLKAQILRQEAQAVNLALRVGISAPIGNKDNFNGEDGVGITASLMVDRSFGSLVDFAANLGFRYFTAATKFQSVNVQSELFYSMGLSLHVARDLFAIVFDVMGAVNFDQQITLDSAPLEFFIGGRFFPMKNQDFQINLGGAFALTPGFGTPVFRVFLGITYAIRKRDSDGDGIEDKKDRCPKVKGPKENDGCPFGDKDKDGVKDNVDKCPNRYGPKDNQGCPWPDTDNDGILDKDDKCPKKAGPASNKGCPWGDKDGDGVKDNDDKCPTVAGAPDNKGCPWGDKDKDGVTDNLDKCPNEPGAKGNSGCPWPDSDGDGIKDNKDKCPYVKGVPERQGCPKKKRVQVTQTEIKILERIYFKTGSSRIRRRSYSTLNQVAEVIKNLLKRGRKFTVQVEGHTDNVGGKRYNKGLSQRRASSVRRYLVRKGVNGDLLAAKGFGMEKPLVPNNSRKNRAKNRRVQFKIINKK